VVDDTPENLTLLGEILDPFYYVRVANSGDRALKIANTEPKVDIVLLDIMMPGMDGYEVLEKIRANMATEDIPVIFVTAKDSEADEITGLGKGAVDYITKPYRPEVVLARVRTQLQLKAARSILADQNTWLEEEVSRRMRENEIVQDVALRALASLAEMRDTETGEHILRTQRYVEVLAKKLATYEKYRGELTPEKIRLIVKASPLHDIGKVGIPDNILRKPGKLTADEWTIMQQHAEKGASAIWHAIKNQSAQESLDFLRVAMDIAHFHHEKWDGSGYPKGLSGDDIPIAARVMALADVFDALTSKRIYKDKFSFEESSRLILEGSGVHFDPLLVKAFEETKDQFVSIALELSGSR